MDENNKKEEFETTDHETTEQDFDASMTDEAPQMADTTWEEAIRSSDESDIQQNGSMEGDAVYGTGSEEDSNSDGMAQTDEWSAVRDMYQTDNDPRWSSAADDSEETENTYGSYEFSQPSEPEEPSGKKNKKTKKEKKEKNGGLVKGFFKCIGAGVVIGLVAFGIMFLMNELTGEPLSATNTEEESTTSTTISTTTPASSSETTTVSSAASQGYDVADITDEVMPTVVAIVCTGTTETTSFFGTYEQEFTSSGSGVIVGSNDTELLIATNNHVIADAESITVTFVDDSTATAVVKGKSSDMDLAIVAVKLEELDSSTTESIKIATLGDSDELRVGETVIAIGNALGYGQSVTCGIVSALNREVTITTDSTDGFGSSGTVTAELIQTDAAINPGNSGGPLFNTSGEVIGINSVKYASDEVEGMGYAIPITEALPILEELMNMETKEKVAEEDSGYIGITGADVTSDAMTVYGMPAGAYVVSVEEDSPAEEAGIKKGDIIVNLGGTDISSMDDLQEELLYYEAGTTVEITVARSDSGEYVEQTLTITLGSKPVDSTDSSDESSDNSENSRNNGGSDDSGSIDNSGESSGGSGIFGW